MALSFLLTLAAATAPQPITSPSQWVPYPVWALRDGVGGRMIYDASVDASGKPTDCRIIVSTGSPRLDSEACAMILKQGRFYPAKNADGLPETGVYRGGLHWTIQS
jgi:periplasmic protein TonB